MRETSDRLALAQSQIDDKLERSALNLIKETLAV
jgi:hypothetical protein